MPKLVKGGDLEVVLDAQTLPFQKRDKDGNPTGEWVHAIRVQGKLLVSQDLLDAIKRAPQPAAPRSVEQKPQER